MKTLVTGPDGFVGSAVCQSLTTKGNFVRGAQWMRLPLSVGCESVVVGDIGSATDWSSALNGVDAVVHLAARVHVMKDTAADPLEAFRNVNLEGTRRLAEKAVKAGVKRFVFLSSIKVNGEMTDNGNGPFTEKDMPDPGDAYAVSKWEAEQALREIEKQSGMEVVVIRPPIIYGPGVKANFLKLVKLIDCGIPFPFGSIQNKRSLLSLTNIADLICCCLEHPAASGKTILASDGEDVSTPELIRRIAQALNKPARLFPVPECVLKIGGTITGKYAQVERLRGSLQIDSGKARRMLEWTPPSTMNEELARVAKWWNSGKVG